jgi:hypothetical protein
MIQIVFSIHPQIFLELPGEAVCDAYFQYLKI